MSLRHAFLICALLLGACAAPYHCPSADSRPAYWYRDSKDGPVVPHYEIPNMNVLRSRGYTEKEAAALIGRFLKARNK
jgi:hypothetical protein